MLPKFNINRIIWYLLVSDIFIQTGFGLTAPILAIFINDHITGGSVLAVGIAEMIYFATKSATQLPMSKVIDKFPHKARYVLIAGALLTTVAPIIYIFAKEIWWIYLAQFIYGLGSGLNYPAWLGIWSRHLDKGQESFEWSLYATSVEIGIAAAAAIGATVAQLFGFEATFALVSVFSLSGCLLLLRVKS